MTYRRRQSILLILLLAVVDAMAAGVDEVAEILGDELKAPVRGYSTQDFGRAKFENAISVLVPEKQAEAELFRVRKALPKGALAFLGTTRNLSNDYSGGVEIVALVSDDKFDILRAAQSNGINHGHTTSSIIERLKVWDESYGIDIWHAETDTIQLRLERLPTDLDAFAREVYEFCPDIIDQGSGNISDIANYLRAAKSLYLWWD